MTASELEELVVNSIKSYVSLLFEELRSKAQNEDDITTLLITRQQVAKMFDISTVSLDKWKRAGILPKPVKMAGRVYYQRQEILDVIAKRKSR